MRKILQLKLPPSHHNPSEVLCVPTCIKNVIDSQFAGVQISRSSLNRWCQFDGKTQDILGLDALGEYFAPKLLEDKRIAYKEGHPGKLTEIINLINQGIFVIIAFKLEDYAKWKPAAPIDVEQAGLSGFHSVIVCGYDDDEGHVYLYDPLFDKYNKQKYKSTNINDVLDRITTSIFTQY